MSSPFDKFFEDAAQNPAYHRELAAIAEERKMFDDLFASCAENSDLAHINVDGDNDVLCNVDSTEEFFVFSPLYEGDIVAFGVKKAITPHLDPTEGIFDEVPISVELDGAEIPISLIGKVEFLRVVNYLNTRHSN